MRKLSFLLAVLLIGGFIITAQAYQQPSIQNQITTLNDGSIGAIEVIGHLGGSFGKPLFEGDKAYLPVGHSLGVLDISDLTHISELGNTGYLPISSDTGIGLGNSTVSIFNDNILFFIDIQDPSLPTQIGDYQFNYGIGSATVSGQYVYVSANNQLHVLHISDPTNPSLVYSLATPATFKQMIISGSHLIAIGAGDLQVIDIATPGNPQITGSLTALDDAEELAVSGNRAYVETSDSEFAIIGVSEMGVPVLLGTHTFEFEGWDFITDLAANGNTVYVTAYTAGLRIVDTSNPASPSEVGDINTGWFAWQVAALDDTAFVIDIANTMLVYNVSPSGTPSLVGTYNPMGYTSALDVEGEYAYLYDKGDGMRVVNVSDPTGPTETTLYPFANYSEGIPVDVKSGGRYVYVSDTSRLRKVDVLDPANPLDAGLSSGSAEHLALYGAYGYATDRFGDLKIYDFSGTPNQINTFSSSGIIQDVTIQDRYAYLLEIPDCDSTVCTGTYKLQVLDLATPGAPQPIGAYDFPYPSDHDHDIEDFAVSGDYAYIAESCHRDFQGPYPWFCTGGGLHIVDISNPNQPSLTSSTFIGATSIGAIYAEDTYAFMTSDYLLRSKGGFEVWDVKNPASPNRLAKLSNISASHIVLKNDLIYINDDGLTIIEPNFQTDWVIPPAGSVVTSTYDNTSYHFSSLTFNQPVTVTHSVRVDTDYPLPQNLIGIGHAFDNSAVDSSGQTINPSDTYTITIIYSQDEVGAAIEETLALYYWDGAGWQLLPSSGSGKGTKTVLNSTNKCIVATTDQFGFWAVLGETNRIYLPLIRR
jgi:hypothetical protein